MSAIFPVWTLTRRIELMKEARREITFPVESLRYRIQLMDSARQCKDAQCPPHLYVLQAREINRNVGRWTRDYLTFGAAWTV